MSNYDYAKIVKSLRKRFDSKISTEYLEVNRWEPNQCDNYAKNHNYSKDLKNWDESYPDYDLRFYYRIENGYVIKRLIIIVKNN